MLTFARCKSYNRKSTNIAQHPTSIIDACSYAYNIHTFKTALADRRY